MAGAAHEQLGAEVGLARTRLETTAVLAGRNRPWLPDGRRYEA